MCQTAKPIEHRSLQMKRAPACAFGKELYVFVCLYVDCFRSGLAVVRSSILKGVIDYFQGKLRNFFSFFLKYNAS